MSNQYIMAKWTDDDYKAYLKGRCIVSDSGCWLFQGFCHKPPRNYGNISHRGKKWATHRLTYFLYKGSIPKGMVVMHSCDTPPCCNPDHLELGTHLQNMADCRAKNRYHYANLTHCKRGHEFNRHEVYRHRDGHGVPPRKRGRPGAAEGNVSASKGLPIRLCLHHGVPRLRGALCARHREAPV